MRRALRRLRHHVWIRVHRAEQRHAERLELHDLATGAEMPEQRAPRDGRGYADPTEWGPCG